MEDHGRGRWEWYHAGAEEPGMAAGASGWRSGRTQETTHNDAPKKGRCEWDHAGAEEPGMAAGAAGWRSGRTQETTHNDVLKKLDWLYEEHGLMKTKMAHMEEQMDHQKREIENLKEELKGLKEGPRAPVPAASSSGPIPSPRGTQQLVCVHMSRAPW